MADPTGFTEAYAHLNTAQKKAVDTVEGPVLVIAGPGTGKTHILTLRIANILQKTDAKPDSLLVLTFTDSAARTVSKRLGGLIGDETARKVGVFTFHSFAEQIMKQHPEAFPEYTDRRLMGDVEHVLLWRDILEREEVVLLRTPKAPYHYLNDLKSLEDDMTRECLSLENYQNWLDEEAERIEADPALRYVRGDRSGELNEAGKRRLERLEKGREAARLIRAFRTEKDARGLYGYTDVLRIAVDGIQSDEALRADLQERYQYVLADEHQDANALQHALLDTLAFDEHPNIFVVGDEKQAIFGFQGADTTHFKTFVEQYPRAEVIPLTDNYRSYQEILDLSHTLLGDLPSSTGGHVALTASRGTGATIHLLTAADQLAELDQVSTLVREALEQGTKPHEIAVITLKNKTADLFATALRARGIPVLRAGNIDLEGRPSLRYLLSLMYAVGDPTDVASLREALLAPWWQPSLAERTMLLRQTQNRDLEAALLKRFPQIAETIATLRTQAATVPPLSTLSYLLTDSGARGYFLSDAQEVSEDVPLVRQLMMHIEELARRNVNATFGELMDEFKKAREHEIGSIKTSLTQREGFVTVITAHKAKGMEFEKVFVTSLSAREWEGRGRSALVPSPFDTTREKEEVIRLFYVALTRAKNELVLSYPLADSAGKEQAPISILPPGLPRISPATSAIPLLHHQVAAPDLVRDLTLRYLTEDGLSPSAYNEYLISPATFFARRVLRLMEPETRAIAVGNAVHAAVAAYLSAPTLEEDDRRARAHAELNRCLSRSLLPRGDSFDAFTRHARASLDSYLGSDLLHRTPVAIEEVFTVRRTVDDREILLKGKVDAVFAGDAGECIVDFKTATKIDKKDQSRYERQLAFYDLLLRANGHTTTDALIIQIGDEEVNEYPIALTADTRAELEATLAEVLKELMTGEWRAGEPSEYDDLLKLFN